MSGKQAMFFIGQCIHHRLFDYRGVIIDADPEFAGSDQWYEVVARSRPPRNEPWYHVLVHDSDAQTYVAQRNLESDSSGLPINHILIEQCFSVFKDGAYQPLRASN